MQEYLIILLAISLALLVFIQLVIKSIPLSTRIIYCTVAISFILGATFPEAISKLTMDKVLGIYLGLIAFSAIALSYIESRFSKKINTIPANVADLESEVPKSASDFASSLSTGEATTINSFLPLAAADVTPDAVDVAGDDQTEADIEQPVLDFIPDLPVTLTAQPVLPVDAVPDIELPLAAADVTPDAVDVAGDETSEVELEQPVPDFIPDLPVTLTAQPILPVDAVPDIELPLAAADVTPDAVDVAGDETSEVELEQPVPDFIPDLPVTLTAQPVLPADAVPDIELPPAAADVTPDAVDVAGDEAPEPDYFKQVVASLENNADTKNNADIKMEAPAATINDGIINDYISAGFEAKARGDLNGAVNYFLKAFQLNQGQQVLTALAMEIATVYQELGQYFQAEMIINSVLEQEDLIHDFSLKQKLKNQKIYLDTLIELLRTTKMSNAPYSKVPNLIKMKASIETSARLTNLTKEAG
ncbi:hypothetical protein L7E55_13005 [Pelotomaculum isophthalicicum JI]|uniref:Uncharacterized protein n=1 Tax=Pelotomaculum isophthalicicum JI TaxID=947010 RepID=A0A9X4H2X6_9FIRM|nr:hypothetical protein [Pelotomaculum isophthalicicum]MDF9409261.1 hypothetical protein [Pelotomaculum isophthalicicum JI]